MGGRKLYHGRRTIQLKVNWKHTGQDGRKRQYSKNANASAGLIVASVGVENRDGGPREPLAAEIVHPATSYTLTPPSGGIGRSVSRLCLWLSKPAPLR